MKKLILFAIVLCVGLAIDAQTIVRTGDRDHTIRVIKKDGVTIIKKSPDNWRKHFKKRSFRQNIRKLRFKKRHVHRRIGRKIRKRVRTIVSR